MSSNVVAFCAALPLRTPSVLHRASDCRLTPVARSGGTPRRARVPLPSEEYAAELAEAERKYGRRGRRVEAVAEERAAADADYERVRRRLLNDTIFVGALWLAATWAFGSVADVESALLGALTGVAYVLLLSPDVGAMVEGGGVLDAGKDKQPLRFLLLPVLVLCVAKSHGVLHILPAVAGFFSYKVALLIPLLSGEAFAE